MVKVWAEKELRNLRRLEQAGIRAPRVIEGKENVLVMEFLGVDDTYVVIKYGLAYSIGLLQG